MLLWTKQFETGVREIDEQHRQLFRHVNELEGLLMQTNFTRAEIERLIGFVSFLEDYVVTHFSFEEKCMDRFRCPMHEKNRQAHAHFLGVFRKFHERIDKEGLRLELVRELNQAINAWIEGHILAVDTSLRRCSHAGG